MCHSSIRLSSALRPTCSSGSLAQERPGPAGTSPEDATEILNFRNKDLCKKQLQKSI